MSLFLIYLQPYTNILKKIQFPIYFLFLFLIHCNSGREKQGETFMCLSI